MIKKALPVILSIGMLFTSILGAVPLVKASDYPKIDLSSYVEGMTSASNFAQDVVTASASYENWGIGKASLIDGERLAEPARFIGVNEADVNGANPFTATWITLDLKNTYKINKYGFATWQNASPAGMPTDFTIEVSNDNATWTTVYTQSSLAVAATQTNWYEFTFAETEARYVKINVTGIGGACDIGNYVCLREIEVYGELAVQAQDYPKIDLSSYVEGMTSASNFAQDVVTASASYENWGIGKASLIDGERLAEPARFIGVNEADVNGANPFTATWITLDLKNTYKINKYGFATWQNASPAGMPTDFTIEVSNDNATWTTVYTQSSLAVAATQTNWYEFTFAETEARYVKINVTGIGGTCDVGNYVCLREIEVYGELTGDQPVPNPGASNYNKIDIGENQIVVSNSLEQPAWGAGYGKNKLVDGGDSGVWAACGHDGTAMTGVSTDGNVDEWVYYDLGKNYTIDMLRWKELLPGTLKSAPAAFKVYVSNSTDNWGEAVCEDSVASGKTDGWYAFSFEEKVGRYVKFAVSKTGGYSDANLQWSLQLAELEVYGESETPVPIGNKINLTNENISVSRDYNKDGFNKGNLVDGNTETSFSAILPSECPGKRLNDWIQLDLQQEYTINKIRLASRANGSLGGFPVDFDIQTSKDGETWTTVKTVTEVDVESAIDECWYEFAFNETSARYVRLDIRDIDSIGEQVIGYAVVLREFEVYTPTGKIDLTKYAPDLDTWMADQNIDYPWASNYSQTIATASRSYELWGWGLASLIDGYVGDYAKYACAANSDALLPMTGMNDTITVDFKAAYMLDKLRFASYLSNSAAGVPENFVLEISLDGVNWKKIIDKAGVTLADGDGRWYEFNFPQTTAVRYARMTVTKVIADTDAEKGFCLTLSEMELYGTKDESVILKPDNYGKIDLSKAIIRATNSYNMWGHGAGNLYNGSVSAGLFIATSIEDADYYSMFKDQETFENKCDEFLKIKFDGIYSVDCMKFQSWWTKSGQGVPKDYSISASLDGKTWTTLYTTDSQEVSETDWYTVEFPAVECRYVKIQFNSVVEACDLGYCAAIRELEFYGSLVSKDNIDLNVDMPEYKEESGITESSKPEVNSSDASVAPETGTTAVNFIIASCVMVFVLITLAVMIKRRKFFRG